jgi:hypothetical protein
MLRALKAAPRLRSFGQTDPATEVEVGGDGEASRMEQLKIN